MTNLLIDLDDTLYAYQPAEDAALESTLRLIADAFALSKQDAKVGYVAARDQVKARIGGRGSSHSRLAYLLEWVHQTGRTGSMSQVRAWERHYWGTFIERATLDPHARALLQGCRANGGRVAIVTDLTLDVQLWKLEAWGILPLIDALVVSEEVQNDKPDPASMRLAMQRLGNVDAASCVMIGDSESKDGEAARSLGIPFYLVGGKHGQSLVEIGRTLGLLP